MGWVNRGVSPTTSFLAIPFVIGSSLLSSVISFHVIVWANAQAQGSDDLDHERDITLAFDAAIPDLISETHCHFIQAGSCCLMALARRFEWNLRAKPVAAKDQTQSPGRGTVTNRKGPFDER